MINPAIFRLYDIRGNSVDDLEPCTAYKVGFCFAKMVVVANNKTICIGRDGRLSSPGLYHALSAGIIEAGGEVVALGLAPTPLVYFVDKVLQPAASVMITASHNPKEDNGFKMVMDGKPFFGEQIEELRQAINSIDWKHHAYANSNENLPPAQLGAHIDFSSQYIDRLLDSIKISPHLKVAWDCGNGATGEIVEKLKKSLANTNLVINSQIDGNFPSHPPDPTVQANLTELINLVKRENCDIGIGLDGDGDRLAVVTKNSFLLGDQLLCLFARDILAANKGAAVIMDVKASGAVIDQIKLWGGNPVLCRTGHSFIKEKMGKENALLAGEMSGHLFFADKYYGYDDAIYAALRLLELLSCNPAAIEEMLKELPKAYSSPEIKVPVADSAKFGIMEEIKKHIKDSGMSFLDIDGVRVTTPQGWWLLRASNTSACLIARCESASQEGLEELKLELKTLLARHNLSYA